MTLCCLTDIDLYQKIHYTIWCLLGYMYYSFSALKSIKLCVGKYNYKWRKLSKCVQNRFYNYTCLCLLGYICSCFLHTLDRLVRGYKLSRFCTLPRKSRRFIARTQKLVYSISTGKHKPHILYAGRWRWWVYSNYATTSSMHETISVLVH
jgi:hypothetical protein